MLALASSDVPLIIVFRIRYRVVSTFFTCMCVSPWHMAWSSVSCERRASSKKTTMFITHYHIGFGHLKVQEMVMFLREKLMVIVERRLVAARLGQSRRV